MGATTVEWELSSYHEDSSVAESADDPTINFPNNKREIEIGKL